ncbi:MAG: acyl-CoA dehydrogenase family protein [Lachnospiraceae bacterium]|jgi:butyryl-CoA dehydrogenase|nr:acyl-CoA dehydrogenase family protein [Lachnospiraceae bacterium]
MEQYLMTDDQKSYIQLVRDFFRKEVLPIRAQCDEDEHLPIEVIRKAMDMGLHTLDIPEEYGGAGLDFVTYVMLTEEMSKVDDAFTSILNAGSIACKVIALGGTEEQKNMFYKKVVDGAFVSMCITEADAGSDVSSIAASAVRDGDDYILNGTKLFVSNGSIADYYIVFASTDKSKGAKGISAFLVDGTSKGLTRGRQEKKLGVHSGDTCEVSFRDVRVPAGNLLGKENEGFKLTMETLDRGRVKVAAMAVGVAQGALDYAVAYAKERQQFGQPICKFQGIQFMLADMEASVETARQMVYYAANLIDHDKPCRRAASIAKLTATDNCMKVCTDAVQVLGGYGLSRDYPVERFFRNAKTYQIVEGTNQIQRMVIGRDLCR